MWQLHNLLKDNMYLVKTHQRKHEKVNTQIKFFMMDSIGKEQHTSHDWNHLGNVFPVSNWPPSVLEAVFRLTDNYAIFI